ncbi:MAG: 5'-nucleotidase [Gammaproteobacteria bacterium]|nr:MAG: 5'-nucleotidase [Gammaproteobacteria bacterium]TND04811.1 MAG: 5'-nucleotidase [Gammaproteobacteria bacterium]
MVTGYFAQWRLVVLALLLCALASGSAVGEGVPSGRTLTLLYSGNLDGELEPCGCTLEGDFGGILRRATKIDQLRSEKPSLVAVDSGGLLVTGFASDLLKSEFILKGFDALGYDAVGIQWNDIGFGLDLLQHQPIPWVASNWADGRIVPLRIIERGDNKIAVFSWLDPATSPYRKMPGTHDVLDTDDRKLVDALAEAKRNNATTILLTALSMQEAKEQLPLDNVDILVIRSAYEIYGEPFRDGQTLVIQAGSRGMRIGLLELVVNDAGQIVSWTREVIPLGTDVPESPRLASWYAEYNARVEAAYQESIKRRKITETGESPFSGEAVCQGCHEEIHGRWRESRHSGAYRKLEDVNKAFDPDCIICHTVGFDTPGGFLDIDTTAHLSNVQCESCHGPARAHAESGGQQKTVRNGWAPADICAQCHTQPHSPLFDFKRYWAQIAH